MPTLAILGCTGPTGKDLVREALFQGWLVKAICRNPHKLKEFVDVEGFEAVYCDIFNVKQLSQHLNGCLGVLSCLGVTGTFFPWSEVTILQDTIKVITEAMMKATMTLSTKRLIVMSSWCTVPQDGSPKLIEWFLKPLFLRAPLKDMAEMERYLKEETHESIEWTVVKCPQLIDGERIDLEYNIGWGRPDVTGIKAVEGEYVPGGSYTIKRTDVARFIVYCVAMLTGMDKDSTGVWARQMVSIASDN